MTIFACASCGYEGPRLYRVCPNCQAVGSLAPLVAAPVPASTAIADLGTTPALRPTGLPLWDEALGGYAHAAVLLAGEPGSGKTTLALKLTGAMRDKSQNTLFVSGEETLRELGAAGFALRIFKCPSWAGDVRFLAETDLAKILSEARQSTPDLLILNSLHTTTDSSWRGGTVSQIKHVTRELHGWARSHRCLVLLLAHVSWKGHSQGPRTAEHEVDAVLYLRINDHGDRRLEVRKARPPFTGAVRSYPVPEWR